LQSASDSELDNLFVGKVDELVSNVFQKAPLKTVIRSDSARVRKIFKLNGANFVIFAREYITRVNQSSSLLRKSNSPRKDSTTPRKDSSSSRKDPAFSPRAPYSARKETSAIQKSIDSMDYRLKINYEEELKATEDEKQKAKKDEGHVAVTIQQETKKKDKKNECEGICGGVMNTCVGHLRYVIGAILVFAFVIGIIIYFTKSNLWNNLPHYQKRFYKTKNVSPKKKTCSCQIEVYYIDLVVMFSLLHISITIITIATTGVNLSTSRVICPSTSIHNTKTRFSRTSTVATAWIRCRTFFSTKSCV